MKRAQVVKQGGLAIFIVPGDGKVGVAVKKGMKGAVNRNRVKRRLREYARIHILPRLGKRNVILIAANKDFRKEAIDF